MIIVDGIVGICAGVAVVVNGGDVLGGGVVAVKNKSAAFSIKL